MEEPKIPMVPWRVPEQGVPRAADLPPRPPSFAGVCDECAPLGRPDLPPGSPRNTIYLGSVEWSWAPGGSRCDSCYLSPRRHFWLLWNRYYDDDWDFRWKWKLYEYGGRKGVDARSAAVYLLMDRWRHERDENGLKHYHLLGEAGFLSADEIRTIAWEVWERESEEEGEDDDEEDGAAPPS